MWTTSFLYKADWTCFRIWCHYDIIGMTSLRWRRHEVTMTSMGWVIHRTDWYIRALAHLWRISFFSFLLRTFQRAFREAATVLTIFNILSWSVNLLYSSVNHPDQSANRLCIIKSNIASQYLDYPWDTTCKYIPHFIEILLLAGRRNTTLENIIWYSTAPPPRHFSCIISADIMAHR